MVFKFIKKVFLCAVICVGVLTYILLTNGKHVDSFYEKFTTPKVNSIIMGDSRGFQGITPYTINKALENTDYNLPIYNYAFTIDQAHIGPLYRKSVLKKLTQKSKNGVFVISLTPLMLSSDDKNSNLKGEFIEKGAPPHNMHFVDKSPNYEYLVKNLNYFEFKAMFKKEFTVHKDGWMEINHVSDSENVLKAWKNTQMSRFKAMAKDYSPSEYRMKSLDTLVQTLKGYGDVYLVRLPIDSDFLELEQEYYPEFNTKLDSIAQKNNTCYFDFGTTGSRYFAFDGHHLVTESAELFSKNLCDSILKFKRK